MATKRKNPVTSKLAYDSVRDHVIPSHHQKILDALQKHGEGIYEEIAGWCGFADRNSVARRLLELLNLGKIEKTERKKPTSTGRQAFIYRRVLPFEEGKKLWEDSAPKTEKNQVIQQSLFK